MIRILKDNTEMKRNENKRVIPERERERERESKKVNILKEKRDSYQDFSSNVT